MVPSRVRVGRESCERGGFKRTAIMFGGPLDLHQSRLLRSGVLEYSGFVSLRLSPSRLLHARFAPHLRDRI